MDTNQDVVTLRGITKRYGAQLALRGVSFDLARGEFLVIVGPSGCGKSTVLRIIAGLEQPTDGVVRLGGKDARGLTPGDRNVGMVFQNYALYPHLSVFENLAFGLRAARMPKDVIKGRIREIAGLLELESMLAKRPGELSGGQRQRVALGRALVRRPSLFLMDEPLSNLDAVLREKMRVDLRQLHEQSGVTTVYVTHDQVEAMTMADRILVMQNGEIHQIGTPAEVYAEPETLFVARFFGSPPMNAVRIRLRPREGGWTFLSAEHGERMTVNAAAARLARGVERHSGESDLWLGFRPEYVHAGRGEGLQFSVSVTGVETLGPRSHIHALWGQDPIVFVVEHGRSLPERGATVWLTVPLSSLHFFGADGRKLPLEEGSADRNGIREAAAQGGQRALEG